MSLVWFNKWVNTLIGRVCWIMLPNSAVSTQWLLALTCLLINLLYLHCGMFWLTLQDSYCYCVLHVHCICHSGMGMAYKLAMHFTVLGQPVQRQPYIWSLVASAERNSQGITRTLSSFDQDAICHHGLWHVQVVPGRCTNNTAVQSIWTQSVKNTYY